MLGFDLQAEWRYLCFNRKKSINSVNYNSFLTKDYKNLLDAPPRSHRRAGWTHLHTTLVMAALLVVGTVLVLVSEDAEATRTARPQVSPPPAMAIPAAASRDTQKLTIPLHFPALNESREAEPAVKPAPQALAPDAPAVPETEGHWDTVKVRPGDSLARIFKRQGFDSRQLHDILAMGKPTRTLKHLRPGQVFRFQRDENGQLRALEYQLNRLESLLVHKTPEGQYTTAMQVRSLDTRHAYASGAINSSLFEAGKLAGMNDRLIMDLVAIFGWDIDFALDIRRGDSFSMLYEEQFLDGKKIKDGPILAAEFTTQGHTFKAVRYTDASGRSDYYSPDGHSMRKAFLRTPVDFRRISSRFGKRHHPVLNTMRMHKGVDYAARRGTPIKAAGDGKVIFRGRKGGYGRVIILQHGGHYSTLYAHMSAFKKGIRTGSRIRQGQVIGFVGSSGRATGPHLHYEFRVNGVHRNPLTVRLPDAAPIKKALRQDFAQKAQGLMRQLAMYTATQVALNE